MSARGRSSPTASERRDAPTRQQPGKARLDDVVWQPIQFSPVPRGKLCYFLCGKSSHLPVRDILNEQKRGSKLEPNYETQTYNLGAESNQRHVRAAVKAGCRLIFFVTRYKGKLIGYREHYMVVGYYELDGWAPVDDRWAVRASHIKFVTAEDAFLVTPQTCREWGTTYGSLRYLMQRFEGGQLERLLDHVQTKPDATSSYVRETERLYRILKSQRRLIHED